MTAPERIVFFDGVCVLCDRSMRLLLDIDRNERLRFAPLQGETARSVLARHPVSGEALESVVYVRGVGSPEERAFVRSDAVLAILRDVGGLYRLFSILRFVPRTIRDALYHWIARNRYRWFGKLDSCRLPTADTTERFLP